MQPTTFATAAELRAWFEAHHAEARELLIAFNKTGSGRGGLTYAEALDEALCCGWIDGIRKRLDDACYTIRFTPRKPGSIWSNVNLRHVERLKRAGRMRANGLAAFAARSASRTGIYSFEQRPPELPRELARVFRAKKKAWAFWQRQPPGLRRRLTWWVVSAKQDVTRTRRLNALIAACAAERTLADSPAPSTRET